MLELTQKSERTITNLEMKIGSLEKEVSTHNAGVDELNREHNIQLEALQTDKAMLEVWCILYNMNLLREKAFVVLCLSVKLFSTKVMGACNMLIS